jgi:hypothetical protein
MGGNSGYCSQSPPRSQVLKKDGLTSLQHNDSKDDDDDDDGDDSGTVEKPQYTKQNNTASPHLWKNRKTLTCIVVGVCVALILQSVWSNTTQDTAKGNETFVREAIENIREEFPSQLRHIWTAFSAGLKETAQGTPTKPSVFMLLYETEEGTAICLAQKVGNMSTHLLRAEKVYPLLIIDGEELEHNKTLAEDYGKLLEEYRPKVEEQRAMIINNLHKIPGTVAQSFHSFCDTVTPVVDKAVFLFTMKASGVISNSNNPTEVAEKVLRKLWSDELDEDILDPLITRITDMTMMITPENNLAPCGS